MNYGNNVIVLGGIARSGNIMDPELYIQNEECTVEYSSVTCKTFGPKMCLMWHPRPFFDKTCSMQKPHDWLLWICNYFITKEYEQDIVELGLRIQK